MSASFSHLVLGINYLRKQLIFARFGMARYGTVTVMVMAMVIGLGMVGVMVQCGAARYSTARYGPVCHCAPCHVLGSGTGVCRPNGVAGGGQAVCGWLWMGRGMAFGL